jgi:hypothetical protein
MPYEFRFDPDDGRAPLTLDFDLYHSMFQALSRADLSLFQPLKRFRGAHAFVVIPFHAIDVGLREIDSIRAQSTGPDVIAFLDRLDRFVRDAGAAGKGVRGGQPYPWESR